MHHPLRAERKASVIFFLLPSSRISHAYPPPRFLSLSPTPVYARHSSAVCPSPGCAPPLYSPTFTPCEHLQTVASRSFSTKWKCFSALASFLSPVPHVRHFLPLPSSPFCGPSLSTAAPLSVAESARLTTTATIARTVTRPMLPMAPRQYLPHLL